MTARPCTACGTVQPLTQYQADARYADGHRRTCRLCESLRMSRSAALARAEAIAALGSRCQDCGITDQRVLCFDHLNGGGRADRKGKGPIGYYRSVLTRLGEFQLLCHNCNYLKRMRLGEHGARATLRLVG